MKSKNHEKHGLDLHAFFNKLRFLLTPFLIGIFPILLLYARNVDEVPPSLIIQPIGFVFIITCSGFLVLLFLTKNQAKSSVIMSLFWLSFYLYVPFIDLASTAKPQLINFESILMPLWGLFFALLAVGVLRSKHSFNIPVKFLSAVGLTICLLQIFTIASFSLDVNKVDASNYLTNDDNGDLPRIEKSDLPDIYYVVLDSYPRSDTLENYFNFSNHEFDDGLEQLGFNILDYSNSNYNHTTLSVPSTFSMSYFNNATDLQKSVLYDLYKKNNTTDYLKQAGYKLIHNSGLYQISFNSSADINIRCQRNNEFLVELVNTTALKPLSVLTDQQRANKRIDSLCAFSNIEGKVITSDSPKFVFTHLLPPHPPYLFNEQGEDTTEENLSLSGFKRWLNKEPYIEQLKYVNKRILESATSILNESRNSIIIIQSDHGTLSSATEAHNLSDTRPIVLKERSRNYSAIYLPEYCDENQLYESMTGINTFRTIFNSCFNAGYEVLDDKIYYATPKIFDKNFEEITQKVRSN